MRHHRVSRILIKGMRSIDDLDLDLTEPTVLIGPNGAGKSTIIEACELLRKAGSERPFLAKLTDDHGGAEALLRRGAKRLQLGVRLVAEHGIELGYDIWLRSHGAWLAIEREYAFTAAGAPSSHGWMTTRSTAPSVSRATSRGQQRSARFARSRLRCSNDDRECSGSSS